MKTSLLALALVATLPALAHAEDGVTASVTPREAISREATTYVQLGGAVGADWAAIYTAATVEGGVRLAHSAVWLHGQVAAGAADEGWGRSGHGTYRSLRAGVEARGAFPGTHDLVRIYGGLDVGYDSVGFSDTMGESAGRTVAVVRTGLDVGGANLRFRPGFELMPSASDTVGGLALTAALAYQW